MNYYHITWATHNSRVSERMKVYKVKLGETIILSDKNRKRISVHIKNILKDLEINEVALNVLSNHVHLIIQLEEEKNSKVMRNIKGKTTILYKKDNEILDSFNLWAQKYNISLIKTDDEFINVINYVKNNHLKHKEQDVTGEI